MLFIWFHAGLRGLIWILEIFGRGFRRCRRSFLLVCIDNVLECGDGKGEHSDEWAWLCAMMHKAILEGTDLPRLFPPRKPEPQVNTKADFVPDVVELLRALGKK